MPSIVLGFTSNSSAEMIGRQTTTTSSMGGRKQPRYPGPSLCALTSWPSDVGGPRFFTLAHEIAHNLIEPHNSEHEFYFSAICEAHMVSLSRLISG